jgi:hypothetical protein
MACWRGLRLLNFLGVGYGLGGVDDGYLYRAALGLQGRDSNRQTGGHEQGAPDFRKHLQLKLL